MNDAARRLARENVAEYSTKRMGCELVLNLKTAKTMGSSIPRSVLLRADEIIQ